MQMYFSYEQVVTLQPNSIVVRTKGVDPVSLGPTVRNTVWSLDKDQPVSNIRSMEDIVSTAVARQRFSTMLLGIFAALALNPRGGRNLRRDELLGRTTDARNRHPHGARRTA
jgi:hypothetical protein